VGGGIAAFVDHASRDAVAEVRDLGCVTASGGRLEAPLAGDRGPFAVAEVLAHGAERP